MLDDPITIERPGGESLGETTDTTFTELSSDTSGGQQSVVYDGLCEFQDSISTYDQAQLGDVDTKHIGKAYMPEDVDTRIFQIGDRATSTPLGPGEVQRIGHHSGVLYIRLDPNQ